jgi:FkbM family methyltransferase
MPGAPEARGRLPHNRTRYCDETGLSMGELRMHSGKLRKMSIYIVRILQRLLRPFGANASRTIGGHRFHFDASTGIGRSLLVTGQFERHALDQCSRFIRNDSVIIDVGANVGVHTVHFAHCAPSGRVISIEPSRSTLQYLLRNVAHLVNVVPLNIALSDTTGIKNFFVASDNAYSGLKDTKRKTILHEEAVACFTGDEILLPLCANGRVDLIKIDVEGLELEVLRGLRVIISRHRPVIFCEIFGGVQSNPDPEATVRYCTSLGYEAFTLRGKELVPSRSHDDRLYNYFFIPTPVESVEHR